MELQNHSFSYAVTDFHEKILGNLRLFIPFEWYKFTFGESVLSPNFLTSNNKFKSMSIPSTKNKISYSPFPVIDFIFR